MWPFSMYLCLDGGPGNCWIIEKGGMSLLQCHIFGTRTKLWLAPRQLRMLNRFGIIEDDPNIFLPLRRMREEWLLRNIQTAS